MAEPVPEAFATAVGRGGWPQRIARAGRFAVGGVDAPVVALAGFLLRGGLLVLAIPSVILPSLIGLASMFNVNALGIDGRPTPWLLSVIAWAIFAAAVWLLVAGIVGSVVDVWLVRAAVAADPSTVRRPQPAPRATLLLDMAAVRLLCLLPIGGAIALVAQPLYQAGYGELTLPTNLADPLLLRVAARAAMPIALIVVAWLVSETIAAVVVRRMALGAGFVAAWGGAIDQLVMRPLSSIATLIVTMGVSVVAVGGSVLATGLAFNLCLGAARYVTAPGASSAGGLDLSRDLRPFVFVASALLLVLVWLVSLAIAGLTSAWRSAAWSEETAAAWAGRGRGRVARAAAFPWPDEVVPEAAAGNLAVVASPDPDAPRPTPQA